MWHLTEVLRGQTTENVVRLRHHLLSVFGLCADIPEHRLRDFFFQLEENLLLERVKTGSTVFQITPQGKAWLKKKMALQFVET